MVGYLVSMVLYLSNDDLSILGGPNLPFVVYVRTYLELLCTEIRLSPLLFPVILSGVLCILSVSYVIHG